MCFSGRKTISSLDSAARTRRVYICALVLAVVTACGASNAEPVTGRTTEAGPQAIDQTLYTASGSVLEVRDFRGAPLFVFFFATWDGVSQASLRPLTRLVATNPDVEVLGIAVQPDARTLLDPYERALSPPFPLTYDPNDLLTSGTSPFGTIDGIPTFVLLNADGIEVARHTGFPNSRTFDNMMAEL